MNAVDSAPRDSNPPWSTSPRERETCRSCPIRIYTRFSRFLGINTSTTPDVPDREVDKVATRFSSCVVVRWNEVGVLRFLPRALATAPPALLCSPVWVCFFYRIFEFCILCQDLSASSTNSQLDIPLYRCHVSEHACLFHSLT